MKFTMNSFEPLLIDVGVNLSSGNVRVSKHFLDNSQVGSIAQQMRGKTVSQQMRVNIGFDTRALRMFLHNLPNTRCRKFGAAH
jgi:hypothetical protein